MGNRSVPAVGSGLNQEGALGGVDVSGSDQNRGVWVGRVAGTASYWVQKAECEHVIRGYRGLCFHRKIGVERRSAADLEGSGGLRVGSARVKDRPERSGGLKFRPVLIHRKPEPGAVRRNSVGRKRMDIQI